MSSMRFTQTILSRVLRVACYTVLIGFTSSYAAPPFTVEDQPVAYVGQFAVTNLDVTSGNEYIFSIDYAASDWPGNLHKYRISASGEIADADEWPGGAAAVLDAQHFDSGRIIVTMNGSRGVPFRWQHLSPAQQAALDQVTASMPGTNTSSSSSPLLNFLRGERANEFPAPYGFRMRSSVLGDIIHATPVYCPARLCKADTVFVGANDGMLHAFDAQTGRERFAYIPAFLLPKLKTLAAHPYQHRYFVDGRMMIQGIGNTTVLVGTLGAGGQGAFALDISDAAPVNETVAAAKVLWEITPQTPGFENLGYTYGQPVIAALKTATTALLLPNGYGSKHGHASLFIIHPLTGKKLHEIDTHAFGGSGSSESPNGLSSASVWSSSGNKIDVAFAGDLDGNLWKFDLVNATALKVHATQPAQSITTAPALMKHPFGGALVVFGTGRALAPADAEDQSVHHVYGIWAAAPEENRSLLAQSLTEVSYVSSTASARVRIASDALPDWTRGHHKGWKTPLPTGGERLVGDGAFISRRLFQFISSNPAINTGAHPGDTPPYGANWWVQLNALTGGGGYAVLFDLNRDGMFSATDQVLHAKKLHSPVGLYLGGGARSQMLPLITTNGQAFHASFDSHYFLTPLTPPEPMASASSTKIQPKGPSRGTAPGSVAPGGAVRDGKPDRQGEITPALPLGRINWREIEQ